MLALQANAEEVGLFEFTKRAEPSKGEHRILSKNWFTCDATNGVLAFTPSPFFSYLSVTVECEETGEIWEGMITEFNMSMEYSNQSGTYSITCVNENNTVFSGVIYQ